MRDRNREETLYGEERPVDDRLGERIHEDETRT